MARFRLTATGTTPLLMHNARLSSPLDEFAKAMKRISAKRVKTEEDHEEMARLEHAGSLYFEPEVGPYIPGQNFERSLLDAARITKAGKKIERGVFVETNVNPLAYKGPRDVDTLWADQNFRHSASVKVQMNRVTRTRPHFKEWAAEAEGTFDAAIISLEELREIASTAGQMIGIGDWRPRFGRYDATVEKIA